MSWPQYRTAPSTRAESTRSFIRFNERSSVDFPHPDGLIIAVISLCPKLKDTSVTARKEPW